MDYYSAFKKERNPLIWDSINESRGYYAKQNKPGRKKNNLRLTHGIFKKMFKKLNSQKQYKNGCLELGVVIGKGCKMVPTSSYKIIRVGGFNVEYVDYIWQHCHV